MKKLIFIVAAMLCLAGCCETAGNTTSKPKPQAVKPERPAYQRSTRLRASMEVMKFEGHDYLIFASQDIRGGIAVVHSESCPCHDNIIMVIKQTE